MKNTDNNDMNETVTMRKTALTYVEAKLGKMNRRAAKLGLAPFTVEVVREYPGEVVELPSGRKVPGPVMIDVIVTGECPVVEGWTLVARIEHTHKGNIVSAAPKQEAPESLRTHDGTCDHCGKKRARIETFAIVNDLGELRVVGRNCLADFIRSTDARAIIEWWGGWANVERTVGEGSLGSCDMGRGYFDAADKLAWAAAVYRRTGARRGADIGSEIAHQKDKPTKFCGCTEHYRPEAEDIERAEQCIAWVLVDDARTSYMHNLKIAVACGYPRNKNMNLVLSAIPSFDRAMGRETERKLRAERAAERDASAAEVSTSEHVGQPKERLTFANVTIVRVNHCEGKFGMTTIIGMQDGAGNELVWFASGVLEVEPGEVYATLHATVKKHNEFRGVKQTVVTRGKYGERTQEAARKSA